MKKPLPPLNWFRAFEVSARRLSFTAAAEEIGMTQSAVSQQIRALETRFQVALFERHARGLTLTDEGRKLLPQVEAALEVLTSATERFEPLPEQSGLTISASISVTEWIISPALQEFRAAHPGISIRFMTAIWPDEFATSQADVEIRFGSEKQVGQDAELLLPNTLMALKSPDLQGDLTELPLIGAVGTSRGWREWAEAAGVGRLEPTVFVDSYGLALQLAQNGNGVALAHPGLAGHALAEGTLVPVHPARIAAKEGYYLSIDRSLRPAVAFREWLLAKVQSYADWPTDE